MSTLTSTTPETTETTEAIIQEGKTTATIAYITIIGFVIALVLNQDKKNTFVAYHLRQMLGLAITSVILIVINIIPILGWIISILGSFVLLYMWIMGLINVTSGKEKPLPILGNHYAKYFVSTFK